MLKDLITIFVSIIAGLRTPLSRFLEEALFKYPERMNESKTPLYLSRTLPISFAAFSIKHLFHQPPANIIIIISRNYEDKVYFICRPQEDINAHDSQRKSNIAVSVDDLGYLL